jgi:hypothetical protein
MMTGRLKIIGEDKGAVALLAVEVEIKRGLFEVDVDAVEDCRRESDDWTFECE